MAQTRAPSIRVLTSTFRDVDLARAKLIRQAIKIEGYEKLMVFCETHCPKATEQFRKFYNMPSKGQIRAHVLDELLGTYGVEYLFKNSEGLAGHCSMPSDELICTYLNAGDSYAATLIKHHGRWQVGCWGSIAESYL